MTETMFMRNTADVIIVIVMIFVFLKNMASPTITMQTTIGARCEGSVLWNI